MALNRRNEQSTLQFHSKSEVSKTVTGTYVLQCVLGPSKAVKLAGAARQGVPIAVSVRYMGAARLGGGGRARVIRLLFKTVRVAPQPLM